MYAEPAATITNVLLWLRELATIGGIVLLGWNARAGFQFLKDGYKDGKDFMQAVRTHMVKMERFAYNIETNHLKHVEDDLAVLTGRRPRYMSRQDPNLEPIVEAAAPTEPDNASQI